MILGRVSRDRASTYANILMRGAPLMIRDWNRRTAPLAAAAGLAAVLAGCGSGGSAAAPTAVPAPAPTAAPAVRVVASTNVYGSIVSAVGGDRVAVTSIIRNPDADPHEYESTPADA